MSEVSPNAESWRELLQRAPTAVVVADRQLRCVFASDAAEHLIGTARGSLVGTLLTDVLRDGGGMSLHERLDRVDVAGSWFDVTCMTGVGSRPLRAMAQVGPGDLRHVFTLYDHDPGVAATLDRKLALEQLVERVQRHLVDTPPEQIPETIAWCLEEVGKHLGADRSYILSFDHAARCDTMVHEWTAPGTEPELGTYNEVPWDLTPAATQRNNAHWVSAVKDVSALGDDWAVDREFFEDSGLLSILELPLVIDGEAVGGLGFDWMTRPADWTEDDLTLLGMVSASMAQLIARGSVEERLAHRAVHDELTGLANRDGLLRALSVELVNLRDEPYRRVAVVMVDVDQFKVVNDSLGNVAGDALLRSIGERLAASVRPVDTVARLGGDTFAVLLVHGPDEPEAEAVCERLRATMAEPFRFLGRSHLLTVSCGIAVTRDPDLGGQELMRRAGAAMFRSKEDGRSRQTTFDDALEDELARRLELDQLLRSALDRGEFEVHYQPEFDLVSGRVLGAEALLRWRRGGELVPAAEFIGTIETTGLIEQVGRWVLQTACEQAARWCEGSTDSSFVIRVNLAARQLDRPDLAEQVAEVLQASGLTPDRLCLEVTETALMNQPEVAAASLNELDALGVELAIDDFGTGYSSLSYLKMFPLDVLKIDRCFVSGLPGDVQDSAIVRSVIELAGALGMVVTAEGVEEAAQADALLSLGCRRAQGYLFARPVPADEVTRMLAEDPLSEARSAPAGASPR